MNENDTLFNSAVKRIARKCCSPIMDAQIAAMIVTMSEEVDEDELVKKACEIIANCHRLPETNAALKIAFLTARILQLERRLNRLAALSGVPKDLLESPS